MVLVISTAITPSAQITAAASLKGEPDRNSQLDLLRAAAILLVVVYHLIQMSPVPLPFLMRFATAGQYGVDLFFVLSGWLIGGLYWKEQVRFGDVQLLRFWGRRWLRTIPPYLGALGLSWGAVFVERHQAFDWGYLAFFQNYYERIPFFLVSWSLCIEEHFYLFVPLLLAFVAPSRWKVWCLFGALIVAAPSGRWWLSLHGLSAEFGFALTATHLRLEGLLLGFLVASIPQQQNSLWVKVQRYSPVAILTAGTLLILLLWLPGVWLYRLGLTVMALGLISVLVWLVGRSPGALAGSRIIKWIALGSYSLYLTHALMLHVARKAIGAAPFLPWFVYFPLAIALIAGAGAVFYWGLERTSIQLRDLWMPRRRPAETSGKTPAG